jgi:hypothetical protein
MDVGRFAPIQRHEEEPIRTDSEDRRHFIAFYAGKPRLAWVDRCCEISGAKVFRSMSDEQLELPMMARDGLQAAEVLQAHTGTVNPYTAKTSSSTGATSCNSATALSPFVIITNPDLLSSAAADVQ